MKRSCLGERQFGQRSDNGLSGTGKGRTRKILKKRERVVSSLRDLVSFGWVS